LLKSQPLAARKDAIKNCKALARVKISGTAEIIN